MKDGIENLLDKRLIVVSNREPYIHKKIRGEIKCERAIGGLTSSLDAMMQSFNGIWIAWGSGSGDKEMSDSENRVLVPDDNPRYTLRRVWLSENEVSNYYYGFSNSVLWPLFHNFLDKVKLKRSYWNAYRRANRKFALSVLDELNPGDLIWIHDYHLCLLPHLIRNENEDSEIGFFLHTPWPPWEIFRTLPMRREILEGLLDSNILGFHTKNYVENFMQCVKEEFNCPVYMGKGMAEINGRKIRIGDFPIGIDAKEFSSISSFKRINQRAKIVRRRLNVRYVVFSIDRLDYTKGIPERLKAIERFFEKYPKFRKRVVFIQVANPSRTKVEEYKEMKRYVDELVGRINGRFRDFDWAPIHYLYRNISREEVIAYYLASDVALVTPLVDGMNLISKEFVSTKEKSGVLILSEFAGAAGQLNDAILANPYDFDEVAGVIKRALEMSNREKNRRLKVLKENVRNYDICWWLKKFFEEWIR